MTEPTFSQSSVLTLLADLVRERMGLEYNPQRQDALAHRLQPLAQAHGFTSLLDYYYLLKYDEQAESEWRRVESALAVNETYFWREIDQIRAAVDHLIPELLYRRPQERVRIWHAACASGEEPYTLAMALVEKHPDLLNRVQILASDMNSDALAMARSGLYRERSFRALPMVLRDRHFTPVRRGELFEYRLNDTLRAAVEFRHLNLLDETGMSAMRNMDIIYCRNAFIYFTDAAIRQATDCFHDSLREPGYLFVAAAESLLRITPRFELDEVGNAFVYRKVVGA